MTKTGVIVAVDVEFEAETVGRLSTLPDFVVTRRPADAVELLAAAQAGAGEIAIVGEYFPDADAELIRRLHGAGMRVVGFGSDSMLFDSWNVSVTIGTAARADEIRRALIDVLDAGRLPPKPEQEPTAIRSEAGRRGHIIAVWGTGSAPGRSTVANCLATRLARGTRTVLVDCDTVSAAQAVLLGLQTEVPQIAALARSAALLTDDVIDANVSTISSELHVVTGLSRSQRWPELKPAALSSCLDALAARYQSVVVDISDRTDPDDEFADPHYDRHAATKTVLDCADTVVIVAAGDPVGLRSLVSLLDSDRASRLGSKAIVAVNKVRASAVGERPEERMSATLQRFAGITDPVFLPWCPAEADRAVLAGRTVAEDAPHSAFAVAIDTIVERLPVGTRMRATRRSMTRRAQKDRRTRFRRTMAP